MAWEAGFTAEKDKNIFVLQETVRGHRLEVLPRWGALWHGWTLPLAQGSVELLDHYKDTEDLRLHLRESFRGARLSPFACRIPGGRYAFEGTSYQLQRLNAEGHAIHGLLYDHPFTLEEVEPLEDGIRASFLARYRGEDPGFPFPYDCRVTYTLEPGRASLDTLIINRGPERMPLVDGWHPYFRCSRLEDCLLQFDSQGMLEFDNRLVPTGRVLPYGDFREARRLGAVSLDNAFLLPAGAGPACTLTDPARGLQLKVFPSAAYRILLLYISPDRGSIALEPLSGAPDAFHNGIGLLTLGPGEQSRYSVAFEAGPLPAAP